MTDEEMVKLYRSYVFDQEKLKLAGANMKEQIQNLNNFFAFFLRSSGVEKVDVVNAAIRHTKQVADDFFDTFFEAPEDRTLFSFKCIPSIPVWSINGSNGLYGRLEINGGESIDDKPMEIVVLDDCVKLTWGKGYIPNRDPNFGPAQVSVLADRTYTGHHVLNNAVVEGIPGWRESCAQHNPWMRLCK